eukprot:976644-Pelagomonas_calceolata.AAC.3
MANPALAARWHSALAPSLPHSSMPFCVPCVNPAPPGAHPLYNLSLPFFVLPALQLCRLPAALGS